MDKNFRVRVSCGICMLVVAVIAMYSFNSIPFKILACLFAIMAAIELLSFFKKKKSLESSILVIVELVFLIYGTMFLVDISVTEIWYVIFGVCGYDVFAYLFGKALGGKIIKKSRPFPRISKNKTWEGTVLGLLVSTALVGLALFVTGSNAYAYLLCGPLALIGDLYESHLKRQFGVKDSNENKFFAKLELIVGGSEGHGGFLDRLDSVAFATTVLLVIFAGL